MTLGSMHGLTSNTRGTGLDKHQVPCNTEDMTKGDGMKEIKICPKCSGFIPNNETPGAYMGAISRLDNQTEICSACGTQEALEAYFGTVVK